MTTIVVEELKTNLSQDFTAKRNILLKAIRPYLYKHLSPAGTFTFSIEQNSVTLASKSLTCTEIETNSTSITNSNYAWGPIKFEFDDTVIVRPGTFSVKLTTSGYTFSESAWIGWIREHENLIHDVETSVDDSFENPFTVEFWSYQDAENHF